jgi:hypothetical protein
MVECHEPLVFSGSPVNVFAVEYESPRNDRPTRPGDSTGDRDLKKTAQQLTWLIKLDAFLTARYDGLAVVTALDEGPPGACRPQTLFDTLMRLHGERAPQPGQALVFLYGRIYQEGQEIFLQSYLRRVRFAPGKLEVQPERLSLTLKNDQGEAIVVSAAVPDEVVVFPPRRLLVSDISRITELFSVSGRVYDAKDTSSRSHPWRYDPTRPTAFAVEAIDPSGWIRVRPYLAIDDMQPGWIKVDPEAGKLLHQRMPELDFMRGEIGFLRVRQTFDAPQFKSEMSRAALAAAMRDAFARYDAGARENSREAAARAAALSMVGAASAVQSEGGRADFWKDARDRFLEASRADPSNGAARNLLALAEIALCCQRLRPDEKPETALSTLLDVLSVRPSDRDALANLDEFYRYAQGRAGSAGLPLSSGELTARRTQVMEVRRLLGQ